MAAINPYLTFKGNCEEAFNFYKAAFGGEFMGGQIMRFSSMGEYCAPGNEHLVMHVALPIAGGGILMGSDTAEGMGDFIVGTNVSVAIAGESVEESDRLFAALSEGGKITMPMADAPWGAYFGMFDDKFGIHWMINCDNK